MQHGTVGYGAHHPCVDREGETAELSTHSHTACMDLRIKTTLNIDDTVMAQLKREAARQKRTMSDLVETALRNLFHRQQTPSEVSPLPTFMGGDFFVRLGTETLSIKLWKSDDPRGRRRHEHPRLRGGPDFQWHVKSRDWIEERRSRPDAW